MNLEEMAVKLLLDNTTAVVFGGTLHIKPGFKAKLEAALRVAYEEGKNE